METEKCHEKALDWNLKDLAGLGSVASWLCHFGQVTSVPFREGVRV